MFCHYHWCGTSRVVYCSFTPKKRDKTSYLEKNYVGFSWKEQRWDSFCLVTPNWQCTLPDYQYSGKDPNGFMDKENIVKYLK